MTEPTACGAERCPNPSVYYGNCDVLVGLESLHVLDVLAAEEHLVVRVESPPGLMGCPTCGGGRPEPPVPTRPPGRSRDRDREPLRSSPQRPPVVDDAPSQPQPTSRSQRGITLNHEDLRIRDGNLDSSHLTRRSSPVQPGHAVPVHNLPGQYN